MTKDTFIEILVESKAPVSSKILKVVLYVLTVLFAIGSLAFGMLSMLFALICGILAYFIGMRAQIEYEYSYMNKEMDIDIIYSKQKRKHLATYDLSKMEVMAPLKSYHLDDYRKKTVKTFDYSSKKPEQEQNCYAIYYEGDKKLIIEPTAELVEAIMYVAPRKVFKD